mmetsp:Transcript_31782/g.57527  ORF Transcript_31782/g.57527 Transcript_31782/m.57527 type:complete len:381 (+) Transcript_31782:25-1167(+)|eukprot:CAMPEP_0201929762 /NCGR_PEP_ID=MMETSP0903-20130614/23732_1 /ASSEMBLY_ACC=CAM_ASM_000552 /TAXON_ID=420261 /ORGANISM="Thalassiosira antarctica, Strain CCMP982" /LENGTH=380 /DNA_ID=CAMNT_0048468635 /DNA_START=8 /DNA_END=1150 /DNA_ORIENTATION=-
MATHIAGLQGMAAVHAIANKAEGMLAPLLEVDESSSVSSDESSQYSGTSTASSIKVEVKQTATEMLKTAAVCLALAIGTAAAAGSMILSPAIAVFVMAGISIVNVPYSAYKEIRIIKLPALRSLNNKLREDAHHLEESVDALSEEIGYLQPEAERAATVEQDLRDISAEQHVNVDKIVDLVRENELIVWEMRDNLRQRIVQDVLKIVMMSDKNNDGRFCRVETKMLVLKISLQLQEYGVEFDEGKFYKVMSVDPSVERAIKIVKRLIPALNEDGDSDDSDGEDEDEDTYDMFHIAPNNSLSNVGRRGSTEAEGPGKLSLSITKQAPVPPRRKSRLSTLISPLEESPRSRTSRSPSPPPVQEPETQRKRDKVKAFWRKHSD